MNGNGFFVFVRRGIDPAFRASAGLEPDHETTENRMFRTLLTIAALAAATSVHALPVTARITADNHYGLYVGQSDGSGLQYIGRNELGDSGSSGGFNWSVAESWAFNANAGDHVYVVAWDDGGPQMWIGDFQFGASELVSNLASWEYVVPGTAGGFLPSGNPPVSLAALDAVIDSATWASPLAQANNGVSPWGTIAGVDSDAKFIWHDRLSDSSTSDGRYVVFRSVAPLPVPEPGSLALAGLALVCAAAARRRRA